MNAQALMDWEFSSKNCFTSFSIAMLSSFRILYVRFSSSDIYWRFRIANKGKDPTDYASNWLIPLLNTNAKILAKILAYRLESVLAKIILKDRTGFMKGRQSHFNLRRLFNIFYTDTGVVLSVRYYSLSTALRSCRVYWVFGGVT